MDATNMPASFNTTLDKLKDKAIDFSFANGPKIITALLILVAGFIAAKWVDKILMRGLNKRDMEPPVRMLISRIVKLMVLLFALVSALGTAGVDVLALVAGISIAGVGVGLAMQGVLSNVVAGLSIIFTKPFRVGEYVQLVGVQGQVTTIELFSTTLQHSDQSKVVIPNRKIVGEILHNYGNIRQLDLSVGVAYASDMPRVLSLLRGIVTANPRVLKAPVPGVGISSLSESCIFVAVKPWTSVADYGPAGAEIYQTIVDTFRAQKIDIPYPQREVRMLTSP
jgi:small conductance mechanosensitive channel